LNQLSFKPGGRITPRDVLAIATFSGRWGTGGIFNLGTRGASPISLSLNPFHYRHFDLVFFEWHLVYIWLVMISMIKEGIGSGTLKWPAISIEKVVG